MVRVNLKFDGWRYKTIGQLFYVDSSFVHHYIDISEFNWSHSPEPPNLGQNWWFFLSHVTLKFDRWPWKTIGHLICTTSSFVHHFVAIGELKLELQFENAQFGSKLTISWAVWPWNLTDDLEKQQGSSPKQHQALCIISLSDVNLNWSYGPETDKFGFDLCDLDFWPWPFAWTSLPSYHGNHSWKFHNDTMMGT